MPSNTPPPSPSTVPKMFLQLDLRLEPRALDSFPVEFSAAFFLLPPCLCTQSYLDFMGLSNLHAQSLSLALLPESGYKSLFIAHDRIPILTQK